ncbi:glycoside hydrolase family 18 protein [Sporobolomyces koalae]|uniref:glycoside hydrolase family 18 protein n=1 Tax=Sporobolomyces koalae TaxID=500713 RepID=UPI00317A8870
MLYKISAVLGFVVASAAAYGTGFTGQKVVSGFYPSYSLAPADIDFAPYTHLSYFVFTTTPSASAVSQAGIDDSTIIDFVTRAKAAGVTAGFTVGGWTGSQYFSSNVATAQNRTLFAQTLLAVVNKYGFDGGISIDWEYPGVQGEGDNIVSPNDADNYLLFLQTLRNLAGPNVRLQIDVPMTGIQGANGPLTDMSAWAAVLDYLSIMTYDVTGPWSGYTGPNSPLYSTCQPPNNKISINDAITTYLRTGFTQNHITIGAPFYSYSFYVKSPLVSQKCSDGSTSIVTQYPSSGSTCGNFLGSGPQYKYSELVEMGYFKPQSGFRRLRDTASQTVVLYNPTTSVFIPTEDPITIWAISRYAFQRRLAGLTVFDISGDYQGQLASQIQNGLNINKGAGNPSMSTSNASKAKRATLKRHLERSYRSFSSH